MARASQHRDAIIGTAARLFRKQGYAATGLNQIVQESGAPKGSLYHYFPAGKEAIGIAAVAWAADRVERTLIELASQAAGPGDLLRSYARLVAGWMSASSFRDGCPIATILLESAPKSEAICIAGDAALTRWAAVLCQSLEAAQVPAPRAMRLAHAAIAMLEGALIQARVLQRPEPILDGAEEMALAFEAAVKDVCGSDVPYTKTPS